MASRNDQRVTRGDGIAITKSADELTLPQKRKYGWIAEWAMVRHEQPAYRDEALGRWTTAEWTTSSWARRDKGPRQVAPLNLIAATNANLL